MKYLLFYMLIFNSTTFASSFENNFKGTINEVPSDLKVQNVKVIKEEENYSVINYPFSNRFHLEKGNLLIVLKKSPAKGIHESAEWVNNSLYRYIIEKISLATKKTKQVEIYYMPITNKTLSVDLEKNQTPEIPKIQDFTRLWTRDIEFKVIENEIHEIKNGKKVKVLTRFQDTFEKPTYKNDDLPNF